jgi:hypothetical protein
LTKLGKLLCLFIDSLLSVSLLLGPCYKLANIPKRKELQNSGLISVDFALLWGVPLQVLAALAFL